MGVAGFSGEMMFGLAVAQRLQPGRQMVNNRNRRVYFENILITSLRSRRLVSRSHLTILVPLQFLVLSHQKPQLEEVFPYLVVLVFFVLEVVK